jgi:hypothetical protein
MPKIGNSSHLLETMPAYLALGLAMAGCLVERPGVVLMFAAGWQTPAPERHFEELIKSLFIG